jgi:hypothetical protein
MRAVRVGSVGNHAPTAGALFAGGGQPSCPAGEGAVLALLNSTFRGNTLTVGSGVGAGGAAFLLDGCATSAPNFLEGNVFEGNTLRAVGSEQVVGAGLTFGASASTPPPVTQIGNVFSGNRIEDVSGPPGRYGGAGEWVEGASLASIGDRFSGNTLPGSEGSNWSYGAGLGIVACNSTTASENRLENAVVEGNAIAGGSAASAGGAGIYSGCGLYLTTPDHLQLLDSTVTENSVPAGGVAGVYGKPSDHLSVTNSIVAADVGGSELGGFTGPGGSLSASHSDVCQPGGVAPLAGEGNICANPLLADNGNPSSVDVRETAASPTIDAGSNALVPSGLTSDFFGAPRIAASVAHLTCGAPILGPAVVDMGASEFSGTVARGAVPPCVPAVTTSVFAFPSLIQGPLGVLHLTFATLQPGSFTVKATYKRTRTVFKKVKGHRRRVRRTETLKYGTATATVTKAGTVKVTLKPTAQALKALAHQKHLKVLLRITYTQTGLLPSTQTKTITVTYKRPPKHGRRHH